MDLSIAKLGAVKRLTAPGLWLIVFLAGVGIVTTFGPAERSLGINVRVVYLHGAWVWAGLAGFAAAGVTGLAALLTRWGSGYAWSAALGRTGLVFWITYLPISLWAMQTNWNGLFLAEPRWRLAAIFAISGLLLQVGLAVWNQPKAYAAGNIGYVAALLVLLRTTEDVLHPASPIFSSDSSLIRVYFVTLLALTLAAAWQMARLWLRTLHLNVD